MSHSIQNLSKNNASSLVLKRKAIQPYIPSIKSYILYSKKKPFPICKKIKQGIDFLFLLKTRLWSLAKNK